MSLLTPPLTPKTHSAVPAMTSAGSSGRGHGRNKSTSSLHKYRPGLSSPLATPDDEDFALPPPLEAVPDLEMPAAAMDMSPPAAAVHAWRPGMSREDKDAREEWLADARGRRGLRIVIVTGKQGSMGITNVQKTSSRKSTASRVHLRVCSNTSSARDTSVCSLVLEPAW